MVFTTNQNRQFYVAKAYSASVTENSAKGTIGGVKIINDGVDKEIYFSYKGAATGLRSDRIQLKNLNYIKAIPAASLVTPLKSLKVSLDSNVNEGKVVPGQDYLLRIELRQFYAPGEDNIYFKDAAVHATSDMVASPLKFYQKMAESLYLCFSRELGGSKTSNPYLTFTAASDGIVITEKEQSWTLGLEQQEQVNFNAIPTTIFLDGEDTQWGKVRNITPSKSDAVVGTNALGNGKKIADMEYFYMGERGDQYRMAGYPNYIPTEYLVDPEKQYNVLEIHYGFTDTGVNSYRSEKDITIVAEDASVINSIITAINSGAGLSINTLTV